MARILGSFHEKTERGFYVYQRILTKSQQSPPWFGLGLVSFTRYVIATPQGQDWVFRHCRLSSRSTVQPQFLLRSPCYTFGPVVPYSHRAFQPVVDGVCTVPCLVHRGTLPPITLDSYFTLVFAAIGIRLVSFGVCSGFAPLPPFVTPSYNSW
jgi:hypothetical protein